MDERPNSTNSGTKTGKVVLGLVLLALLGVVLTFRFIDDRKLASEAEAPPEERQSEKIPTPVPDITPSPEPTAQPSPEPAAEPEPIRERVTELPRFDIDAMEYGIVPDYVSVNMTITDVYGDVLLSEPVQCRTHGNSTARFDKRPYKFKLNDKMDLFGLGEGRRFILLANAYDKSLIRNALALDLAGELGLPYVSRYAYAEVYQSGRYRGNYMLIEPVEPGANRVPLHEAAHEYLLEVFMGSYLPEKAHVTTSELGITLEVDSDSVDQAQLEWIDGFLSKTEKALLSGEREQIEQYLDLPSFVNDYILNEYSKNSDTSFASTRFYIKNGKLYAGPPWDFDLSFGNGAEPCDWRHYINDTNPAPTDGWYAAVLWWKELAKLPWFQELFAERYLEMQPQIVNLYAANELGESRINCLIAPMRASIEQNFRSWPVNVRAYGGEAISKGTYEENVEVLRSWMERRNQWILDEIAAGGEIIKVGD